MRSFTALILNAFIAQAYGKDLVDDKDSLDKFIDKLIDRESQMWPQRAELDGTTLGKPGAVMSQRVTPLVSRSSLLSAPRPNLQAPRVAQVPRSEDLLPPPLTWDQKRAPPGGSSYKEWPKAYNGLLSRGLTKVSPEEAYRMAQKGDALIVDVRNAETIWDTIQLGPFSSGSMASAKSGAPEGSHNVPYFRSVQGNSVFDIMKKMNAYMFIMEPTERNPHFKEMALKNLPKNKKLILACNRGGDLESDLEDRQTTTPMHYTSSLKAAHELYNLGYKDLYIMDGGVSQWDLLGLPMTKN